MDSQKISSNNIRYMTLTSEVICAHKMSYVRTAFLEKNEVRYLVCTEAEKCFQPLKWLG